MLEANTDSQKEEEVLIVRGHLQIDAYKSKRSILQVVRLVPLVYV